MRPSKRSAGLVAAVVLLPASILGVAALGSRAGAETGGAGEPFATAKLRDLSTTETITGSLGRAETKTIVYGGTSSGGGLRIAASSTPLVCATPSPAPSPSPSSAAGPTASPSPSPTPSPCASPSPTPTPSPAPTLSPSPSPAPPPDPTPPTEPAPSPEPTPSPDPTPSPEPRAQLETPPDPPDAAAGQAPADRAPSISEAGPGGGPSDPAGGDQTPVRAATLTGVLEVGAVADRGSVLYSADTEPVAVLLAPEALFRNLSTGSSDGDDVQALEENLSAMGLGKGLTVDQNFDSATAAAVKKWEESLGRETPDGIVSVGEVVFIPEPATVISRRAGVGDKLNVGTPVLTLGTRSMVVTGKVDVEDRARWAPETVVRLDWDDQPGTGTVIEVGRDEAGGQVEVTIALGSDAPDVPVGTEVGVSATTAERNGVVAVPVSAIVGGPYGPAVRTEIGELVPVELGIISGGLAEIAKGLEEGTKVRLPG